MKARVISVVIASLLLMTYGASPASAGSKTTDYNGTVSFVKWVDPVPPVVTPGGTVHEFPIIDFLFETSDPRVSGIYVFAGKCTWPNNKPWPWGPCNMTWTLDVNNDKQPDWEGVIHVTPQDYRIFWSGNGHGRGMYNGLNMSFKVEGGPFPPATVTGRVTGN